MKLKTSLITILIAMAISAQGQSKLKELHLYGSIGVKFLQPKSFSYSTNISPSSATIIGGGASWQKSKAQFGGEFFYSNGTSHASGYRSAYSGLNFNFLGGYRFDLGEKFKLSMQSGIGYSLNHLYITDQNFISSNQLNTAIFHNNTYTIPVAIMLQRINARGTFMGIKAGYNFNVSHNHWKYREGSTPQHYEADPEGLYLQLIFGGLLRLH